MRWIVLVCLLAATLAAGTALATTWADVEKTCPVCETVNDFQTWCSYGSYIYRSPSKFQFIFWPVTTTECFYCCKKCGLSTYMWDFDEEKIPAEKIPALKEALADVEKEKVAVPDYTDIPVSVKLAIAEKVYRVLERDDEFWCRFYRVKGYHLDDEDQDKAAAKARARALALAEKMIADPERIGARKEFLLISGAMRHFLKDDPGAAADFRRGAELTLSDPDLSEEDLAGKDGYLTELLAEYLKLVEKEPAEED